MNRTQNNKLPGIRLKKIWILIAAVLVVILLGALVLGSLGKPLDRKDTSTQIVSIEEGSGTALIAQTLYDEGLIKSTFNFRLISKLKGYDGDYKAGKYELSKSMSMKDMMKVIASGSSVTNSYTIPEGYRLQDVAALLEEKGFCTAEDFMYEVQYGEFDYRFMEYLPEGEDRLEGVLFPNTYVIGIDSTAHEIIDQMLSQFDSVFTDDYWNTVENSSKSFYEILTIASIIEGESRVDKDRAKISSVIYNRLDEGMKLQMDSTIQYLFDEQHKRVSTADTEIDSAYNTYVSYGLPPTPICSPGAASIEAALEPAETDYLYFVVSKKLDGSHVFSKDYESFQQDKAEYQQALEDYYEEHPDENEYTY